MAFDNIWQMLTDNVGTVVTVLSAIAAVIGALASRAETRKQRELRTEQLRQTIDSSSLDWGNAAIDTLARAAMLAAPATCTAMKALSSRPALRRL